MSFTWQAPQPLRSREQIAQVVHGVALARGLDSLAAVIALMTISTEVGSGTDDSRQWWCPANPAIPDSLGFPHDSLANDSRSVGYFQQQRGPAGEPWWGTVADMMTLATAANSFLERLDDGYTAAINSPLLAGQFAQRVQRSSNPDRYATCWEEAWLVLNRAIALAPVKDVAVPSATLAGAVVPTRPDYNEYAMWSPNRQDRTGTKLDLFLLHTQEGNGSADSLARYLGDPANEVSYHYTVSQAADGGVTVCDVVDTEDASWSVLSANNRSINLCFAGSRASWTRDQWLTQVKAIDVAAYLAVADCRKYGITPRVITPPNYVPPPGISDHRYVTDYLRDGTHTDVGPNFPWDVFTASVHRYSQTGSSGTTPLPPVPSTIDTGGPLMALTDAEQRELLDGVRCIKDQLGPGFDEWGEDGDLGRNLQGQRRTLRAGLAALMRKTGA